MTPLGAWIALAATLLLAGVGVRLHQIDASAQARLLGIAASSAREGDASAWIFSGLFSRSSPLLTTVAQLKSRGATSVDHQYMDSLWNQGFPARNIFTEIPLYLSAPNDRLVTVRCGIYGVCNANGIKIHANEKFYVQDVCGWNCPADHHLLLVDKHAPSGPIEIDCWQAGPVNESDRLTGEILNCSWAGLYRLGTNGLHGLYSDQTAPGNEGLHFGPAAGTFMVTGTEILNGRIEHALALNVSCLNNPSVYPADTQNGTDTTCDNSTNPPHYGSLIHLLWSSDTIARSAYSAPCKTILTAMATYGAYMSDTGNHGIVIDIVAERAYTSVGAYDPYPAIEAQLNAAGDAYGGKWTNCFNRLAASDFEMLQVAAPEQRPEAHS